MVNKRFLKMMMSIFLTRIILHALSNTLIKLKMDSTSKKILNQIESLLINVILLQINVNQKAISISLSFYIVISKIGWEIKENMLLLLFLEF